METDKILLANIIKKAKTTYEKDILTSTNFLDARQLKLVEPALKKEKYSYEVIRINEEIEKVIIIFMPTYLSLKDIDINDYVSCIKISAKKGQKLLHKDYMGAIYNMGIKRECIGDIFVYGDYSACVFCMPKIADYLKYNLFKVGRYDVELDFIKIEDFEIPKHLYNILEINVPSNRLDNIASETSKISRTKIVDKIINKEVFVNYEVVTDKSKILNEKDVFSIRGIGKFKVEKYKGNSKKGNLILEIKKYA